MPCTFLRYIELNLPFYLQLVDIFAHHLPRIKLFYRLAKAFCLCYFMHSRLAANLNAAAMVYKSNGSVTEANGRLEAASNELLT